MDLIQFPSSTSKGVQQDNNTVLPKEILLQIFSYLELQNLALCERVCKQWKEIAMHKDVVVLKNRAKLINDIRKFLQDFSFEEPQTFSRTIPGSEERGITLSISLENRLMGCPTKGNMPITQCQVGNSQQWEINRTALSYNDLFRFRYPFISRSVQITANVECKKDFIGENFENFVENSILPLVNGKVKKLKKNFGKKRGYLIPSGYLIASSKLVSKTALVVVVAKYVFIELSLAAYG